MITIQEVKCDRCLEIYKIGTNVYDSNTHTCLKCQDILNLWKVIYELREKVNKE